MTRKRNRRRSAGDRENLEGWAAVEEDLLDHDEGTMQAHAGDVDTLLVFAGLFSAVLTAFVVESYQQLQVDTGQKSMFLLQRISIQLESFTLSPGYTNCTTKPPLPSLDFVVDVTARWINILWFLSLIFSLAAALFGILVKQWIREYMQWNNALASPRENVLVRQIRFEAWNDWNVPATIAVVPALLEIALVLFVCGLLVLLWTLDAVVSTVITTTIAVFLAAASTFVVLPAFLARCPYKSPTAWACAVIWDFVTLWIPYSILRAMLWLRSRAWRRLRSGRIASWMKRKSHYAKWKMAMWKPLSANWRQRDLAAVWTSPVPQTRRGDVTPLLGELLKLVQTPANTSAEAVEPQYDIALLWARVDVQHEAPMHNAIRTITELPPLIRALAWVSQASQDAGTQHNVSRCIQALESHFVLPDPIRIWNPEPELRPMLTQDGVRALSIWYYMTSVSPDVAAALELGDVGESTAAIRRRTRFRCSEPFETVNSLWFTDTRGVLPELHVLLQLLVLSVRMLVEKLAKGPFDDYVGAQWYAQSIREQLGIVLEISKYQTGNTQPLQTAANHLMETLRICNGDTYDLFESTFPYLRWYIFQAAKWLRPRNVPWSLLEELHIPAAPEASYEWEEARFKEIKQRQTHLANFLLLPFALSTQPTSSALTRHASQELLDDPLCAISSDQRNTSDGGGQVDPKLSQDSEAGFTEPCEDISGSNRRKPALDECADVVPGPAQGRVVKLSSPGLSRQGSSGHGDFALYDGGDRQGAVEGDKPSASQLCDLTVEKTVTVPQQLVPGTVSCQSIPGADVAGSRDHEDDVVDGGRC